MPRRITDLSEWPRRWLWVSGFLLAVLASGTLLTAGGFALAANLERRDSFCASCHTEPESTYYQRSLVKAVDLAAAHAAEWARCIDCHSGAGVPGRLRAELAGARHILAHISRSEAHPGSLQGRYPDENCLKCHQQALARQEFDNHFHTYLAQWQKSDPLATGCASCHPGHVTDSSARAKFLTEARTLAVCVACHQALEKD
jgi:predicted CXXCH cytochrome family protein